MGNRKSSRFGGYPKLYKNGIEIPTLSKEALSPCHDTFEYLKLIKYTQILCSWNSSWKYYLFEMLFHGNDERWIWQFHLGVLTWWVSKRNKWVLLKIQKHATVLYIDNNLYSKYGRNLCATPEASSLRSCWSVWYPTSYVDLLITR